MSRRLGIELSAVACRIVEVEDSRSIAKRVPETRVQSFARLPRTGSETRTRLLALRGERPAVVVWGLRADHRQAVVTKGSYARMRAEAIAAMRDAGIETQGMLVEITPTSSTASAKRQAVLVALADADDVSAALQPLRDAGIRARTLMTPALALMSLSRMRRAFAVPDTVETYVALEERTTALAVVHSGALFAAREIAWGYQDDRERTRPRGEVASRLADEIDLFFGECGLGRGTVGQVCVCGGLPELRSMTVPLMERLDVEVETLDSLFAIDARRLPAPADQFQEHIAELRLAWVAAADSNAPISLLREHAARDRRTALVRTAAAAAIVAGVGGTAWTVRRAMVHTPPPTQVAKTNTPANSAPRSEIPSSAPASRVAKPAAAPPQQSNASSARSVPPSPRQQPNASAPRAAAPSAGAPPIPPRSVAASPGAASVTPRSGSPASPTIPASPAASAVAPPRPSPPVSATASPVAVVPARPSPPPVSPRASPGAVAPSPPPVSSQASPVAVAPSRPSAPSPAAFGSVSQRAASTSTQPVVPGGAQRSRPLPATPTAAAIAARPSPQAAATSGSVSPRSSATTSTAPVSSGPHGSRPQSEVEPSPPARGSLSAAAPRLPSLSSIGSPSRSVGPRAKSLEPSSKSVEATKPIEPRSKSLEVPSKPLELRTATSTSTASAESRRVGAHPPRNEVGAEPRSARSAESAQARPPRSAESVQPRPKSAESVQTRLPEGAPSAPALRQTASSAQAIARPPVPGARPAREEIALPFDASLGMILYATDRKLAIVDGRIVSIGDDVRGASVIDITPSAVLLRDAHGRLRRLALGPPAR